MPRLRSPRHPVTIRFDDEPIVAERGEPVAAALIAAGRLVLARSPKFHRPRGPSCLRAACDGCLARVDDIPNVMTCRMPCAEGLRVETQNVVGSVDTDLLRVSDWFFPGGMNHHELFAGVPGVERLLQGFARRVAGLGKLPGSDQRRASPGATRRSVDALVVGAGPAGMAAATELSRRGRLVEVVDDDLAWGGGVRLLPPTMGWTPVMSAFEAATASSRIRLRLRTTAAGIYGDDILVVCDGTEADDLENAPRVEVLRAKTLVLAPGAHDGALAFEGNDLPGVMSARAACRLLSYGVLVGERIAVATIGGGSPFGATIEAAYPGSVRVREVPTRASGSGRVRAVTVSTANGQQRIRCDALFVDAPGAPAYELCAQAGAQLSHQPFGFVVRAGPGGRIRDGVFAVGEVVGTPLDAATVVREAAALVDAI